MRFGFVTCVQLGLTCMEEIEAVRGKLDLVLTLPDDQATAKSGRVWVDRFCARHGAQLVKVRNVNDPDAVRAIRRHRLDWLFLIGWSQIAGDDLLAAPKRGVLGMHPTLLPVGRGRASIPWAILKGLSETGVTMFQLNSGIDTGPIVRQLPIPLAADETACTLYAKVNEAHRSLIAQTWDDLCDDRVRPVPQDELRATEWPARRPEDGRIMSTMSVDEAERLVRAVTRPYPGAFYDNGQGTVVRIWSGRVGDLAEKPATGVVRIALVDGVYDATEWELERRGHDTGHPTA